MWRAGPQACCGLAGGRVSQPEWGRLTGVLCCIISSAVDALRWAGYCHMLHCLHVQEGPASPGRWPLLPDGGWLAAPRCCNHLVWDGSHLYSFSWRSRASRSSPWGQSSHWHAWGDGTSAAPAAGPAAIPTACKFVIIICGSSAAVLQVPLVVLISALCCIQQQLPVAVSRRRQRRQPRAAAW